MSITITSPAANTTVSGTINVTGVTTAPTVTVSDSGTALGNQTLSAGQAYSVSISTTGLTNGAQTLSVTDGLTTATVAVTVSNTVTQSPSGTTLTNTTGSIIDASGNVWTLNNQGSNNYDVFVNGATAGYTNEVVLLLWYNGHIYQENQPGNWYESTGLTTWTAVSGDPRGSGGGSTSGIHFYGVNGHYVQGGVYGSNIAQQVADMQAMGIKTMRQDCYNTSDTASIAGVISSFSPIVLQPMFNDPVENGGTTSETTAYNNSYAYGVTVAGQLAGKVPVIELMNEPENFYFTQAPAGNGQVITNWSSQASLFPALRGALRGFVAGFRSVDTTKQTLIASPSVGWLHYGLLDGLWNGNAPDGSTGNPTLRWDLTNYHWYYDMGNIESAGGVNVLSYLKTAYNLPIILTEIGVQTSVSQSSYDSWITTGGLGLYQGAASTYNIVNTCWYQLYTDGVSPDMGLYSSPGTPDAARASTMTSFISAHPMS